MKEQSVEDLMKGNRVFEPPQFLTGGERRVPKMGMTDGVEFVVDERTPVVGMARVGWADQKIVHCPLNRMASTDLGPLLHVLIVPSVDEQLHPMEHASNIFNLIFDFDFLNLIYLCCEFVFLYSHLLNKSNQPTERPMDSPLQLAYFGMQSFLSAESSFACIAGVLKTRVGYAGGTAESSSYAEIAGNTEVTELQFDPDKCTYDDVLDWFFDHHDPTKQYPKHYQSTIFWAERALQKANTKFGGRGGVQTCVKKMDTFFPAQDCHQKYWLRTQSAVFNQLNLSNSELVDSSLAAKLNAFLGGDFTDFDVLRQLQTKHGLSDDVTNIVEGFAELMNMKKCFADVRETDSWASFKMVSKHEAAAAAAAFVLVMENSQLPTPTIASAIIALPTSAPSSVPAPPTSAPHSVPAPPSIPAPRPPIRPQTSSSSSSMYAILSPQPTTQGTPSTSNRNSGSPPKYDPVPSPQGHECCARESWNSGVTAFSSRSNF
uniref:peptide-methionine (S)-S-oxide reductase n=1 Tax=Globodera rostochiensis TaxID=31243 RepID=A0A914HV70_GLORO